MSLPADRGSNSTLITALNVATGQITARHTKRRRRVEFLDFMNALVADYPDQAIHVILDNLSTYTPKRDRWLARHKNVHFHVTPTHASWLNPVDLVLDPRPRHPQGRQLRLGRRTCAPRSSGSWQAARLDNRPSPSLATKAASGG